MLIGHHYHGEIYGNVIQIFTNSPRSLSKPLYKDLNLPNGCKVFIHARYVLNLATPTYNNIVDELRFCAEHGYSGVIAHFGSNSTDKYLIRNVDKIIHATNEQLILETSAGGGALLGKTVDDIAAIYSKLNSASKKRVKFCIDTCHIFVCGHDWHTYIKEFSKKIGIDKLAAIHLNDSKTPMGGLTDRHEEIGKGFLFKDNKKLLEDILTFAHNNNIPLIIENDAPTLREQVAGCKEIIKNKMKISVELGEVYQAIGDIYRAEAYLNTAKLTKDSWTLKKKLAAVLAVPRTKILMKLQTLYGVGPKCAAKFYSMGMRTIKDVAKYKKLTKLQKIGVRYYKDLNQKINYKQAVKYAGKIQQRLGGSMVKVVVAGKFKYSTDSLSKDLDIILVTKKSTRAAIADVVSAFRGCIVEVIKGISYLIKFEGNKYYTHVDIKVTTEKLLPF